MFVSTRYLFFMIGRAVFICAAIGPYGQVVNTVHLNMEIVGIFDIGFPDC